MCPLVLVLCVWSQPSDLSIPFSATASWSTFTAWKIISLLRWLAQSVHAVHIYSLGPWETCKRTSWDALSSARTCTTFKSSATHVQAPWPSATPPSSCIFLGLIKAELTWVSLQRNTSELKTFLWVSLYSVVRTVLLYTIKYGLMGTKCFHVCFICARCIGSQN